MFDFSCHATYGYTWLLCTIYLVSVKQLLCFFAVEPFNMSNVARPTFLPHLFVKVTDAFRDAYNNFGTQRTLQSIMG